MDPFTFLSLFYTVARMVLAGSIRKYMAMLDEANRTLDQHEAL